MDTTYDVRVYKTEIYRGSRVTTYKVRWKAAERTWKRPFRTAAQADVFRGELLAAARKGEAFSLATGEPVSWQRNQPGPTWYEFACQYVDMEWKPASAKYRRAIAQALASATVTMLTDTRGKPDAQVLRGVLTNWAYNTKQRAQAPDDITGVMAWLTRNTKGIKELADPALSRQLLTAATSRLDGTRAAATSVRRNRAVLLNALDYAVELKLLDDNPNQGHQVACAQDRPRSRPSCRRQPRPGASLAGSRSGTTALRLATGRVLRRALLQRATARRSSRPSSAGCQIAGSCVGRERPAVARARRSLGRTPPENGQARRRQ
jgi:hypothetical protein